MPSPKSLRKLPSLETLIAGIPGLHPRPPEIARTVGQYWPDCKVGPDGHLRMSKRSQRDLEDLFELFGVPMKVSENSPYLMKRAWYTFAIALGRHVSYWHTMPGKFHLFIGGWSEDWVQYIEAVAQQDKVRARELARVLQPLSPDCQMPPRIPSVDRLMEDEERLSAYWKPEQKEPRPKGRGSRRNAEN